MPKQRKEDSEWRGHKGTRRVYRRPTQHSPKRKEIYIPTLCAWCRESPVVSGEAICAGCLDTGRLDYDIGC